MDEINAPIGPGIPGKPTTLLRMNQLAHLINTLGMCMGQRQDLTLALYLE